MSFDFPPAPSTSTRFEQAFSAWKQPLNGQTASSSSTNYNERTPSSVSSLASIQTSSDDFDGSDARPLNTPRPPARGRSRSPLPPDDESEDDAVPELPRTSSSANTVADTESLVAYVSSLRRNGLPRTYSDGDTHSRIPSDRLGDSLYKTALQMRHNRNLSTDSTSSTNSDDGIASFMQRPNFPHRSASNTVASAGGAGSKPSTGLETVDLSHKRIAELPLEVISALAGTVERLALGYNYMQTLPAQFSTLGKTLRYLNVRANAFLAFPPVFCELPSLEILDVRGNKIKRMPKQPGSLINLKVLVLSKNRIRRLPAYFAQMPQLRVLKLDHNPIEWPPRDIIALPAVVSAAMDRNASSQSLDSSSSKQITEEAKVMQAWLSTLQTWIREHPVSERSLPLRQRALSSSDDETPVRKGTLTRSNNLTLPLNLSKQTSPPLSSPSAFAETPRPLRRDDGHIRNVSAASSSPKSIVRPLRTKKSLPELRLGSHVQFSVEPSPALPSPTPTRFAPQVGESRSLDADDKGNSAAYFRRLSMLPPSSTSKAVPLILVEFVDAVRGILFALSQIHAAVKQFVVFAAQDRLPAAMSRMMTAADGSLTALINALDRFDSLSRKRTVPEMHFVRDVIEACRENVSVFSKLVGVLGIQLKALTSKADPRYTRTLLLMVYGSLGEIVTAWRGMIPQAGQVARALNQNNESVPPTINGEAPVVENPARGLSQSTSALTQTAGPRARRHAGSFSVEDVQLGAVMQSPTTATPTSSLAQPNGLAATARLRPGAPTLGPLATSIPYMDLIATLEGLPPTPIGNGPFNLPVPVGNITALRGQPVATSPLTPVPARSLQNSSAPSTLRNGAISRPNLQSTASKAVDAEFLDMAGTTAGIAFDVCQLLQEHLPNSQENERATSLLGLAEATKEAGQRLRTTLDQLQQTIERGEDSMTLHRPMFEDSDGFAKIVIQLIKTAKDASSEIQFAKNVREGLSQLAKATHSLLAMRAVSSFH